MIKFNGYNNIGFSLLSFLSVIKDMKKIEYTKSLLILPLVIHNPLISYLKRRNVTVNSADDLILHKVEYFLNYNKRYYDYLSLSINTIIIAQKMGYVELKNEFIIPINVEIKKIEFSSDTVGNRLNDVYLASNNISKILAEDVNELYFKLRIEL